MRRNDTLSAMNRLLQIVAVVCLTAISGTLSYSNAGDKDKDAEALFSRAKMLENLMAPDTPPYLLRIRVVGVGQLGAYPGGTYTFRFLSPSQFRQDRAFGQSRSSVGANGDAKKQWLSGTTSLGVLEYVFGAAASYAYDNPTAYGDPAALEQSHKNSYKITSQTKNGLTMTCTERRAPYWKVCFDATTGAAVAALDQTGLLSQYSDFQVWGTHLVPKQVIVFANNAPILEAHVETLEALSANQANASAFAPPSEAQFQGSTPSHCQIEQAHILNEVRPDYPHSEGLPAGDGIVGIWGIIDETGKISDVIIVRSAGLAFDQAAVAAVRQWSYSPATICGNPVATTSNFQVSFRP